MRRVPASKLLMLAWLLWIVCGGLALFIAWTWSAALSPGAAAPALFRALTALWLDGSAVTVAATAIYAVFFYK